MLDPDLVVGLHARVGVGLVHDVHLVAAEFPAAARGADGIGDRRPHAGWRPASGLAAGNRPRPTVTVADRVLSSIANICSFTRFTTFSAQVSTSRAVPRSSKTSKPLPPKRPHRSRGGQLRAQQFGELRHEIFAREYADGVLDFDETVRLDVGELAHAALHAECAALAHRGYQVALLQKAGRGVVLDGIGELHFEIVILLVRRRYGNANGGFILVVGLGEQQFERQGRAVRQQRLHLEAVARPLALQAGDQRAFERRMRFLLEQIHERLCR